MVAIGMGKGNQRQLLLSADTAGGEEVVVLLAVSSTGHRRAADPHNKTSPAGRTKYNIIAARKVSFWGLHAVMTAFCIYILPIR